MKPITKAQRLAIKRIFDRKPIYRDADSAAVIVYEHGWRFVEVAKLRKEEQDKILNGERMVWIHPRYLPIYNEAETIIEHYAYSQPMTYREFRKLVQVGFDCLMVKWQGMTLGIERDGHVHS